MVGVRLATVLFDKIPPIKRAFHIVIYTTKSIVWANWQTNAVTGYNNHNWEYLAWAYFLNHAELSLGERKL